MPSVTCPHCQSSQEVNSVSAGAQEGVSCASCGRPFSLSVPSPSPTQRINSASEKLPSTATAEKLPARMGPYEIRGIIGTGGMGVVYQGWDERLNRSVAVKTLKPELAKEPAFCERFLREARAVASLSHPNVTQIYYIGEEEGRPFFAMEFLEGKPLDALLREEGKLASSRAAELIRQAALGLKAAAARGVIHRDIKPSNLVLTKEGVLKVTDFGLAKMVVADSGLTLTGEVLGSPNYLAPEQASGAAADLRSDIYSLGATLYELLTGRPPFDGPTPVSIILKHVREPLRSPRQFSPELPVPLVTLTQRMLAKRPEDRPKDYDTLLREMDRLLAAVSSPSDGRSALLGGTPSDGRNPGAGVSAPFRGLPAEPIGSSSGLWIIGSILALGLIAAWGFLKQSRAAAASSTVPTIRAGITQPASPPEPMRGAQNPDQPPSSSDPASGDPYQTRILSTSAEVSPPQLGATGPRQRTFDLPPRMDRLKEVARANLQFVENTHEITLDGRLKVRGSVYNAGLAAASEIKVHVTLTDPEGNVIASGDATLSPPLLSSHQSGTFEVLFPDPHRSISIKAELSWNS
ncbi:MAG: serine/threonine protein kinase [Acidobacteria bacterium]|nr:serine/threonine protein kinase [Acidobacteriota bacterium]MCI0567111.1 serine/threonine protein kinase [Acidobacteriota bacterium]